jgi:hypothetical protein
VHLRPARHLVGIHIAATVTGNAIATPSLVAFAPKRRS